MILKLRFSFITLLSLIFTCALSQANPNKEKSPLRYEKQMNQFDSLNVIEKDNENSILFIGSSYIRKWSTIKEDLDYHDIINRGFGGSNITDVAYHIKRIAYTHQPKAIFIYVGNDITATENDKKPAEVLETYKSIVEILRKKFPTIPITWLAIFPSEKRWSVWDKIQEVNNLINVYSITQDNLYFINVCSAFLGEDGWPKKMYYSEDKLHFNTEGYKLWGKSIAKQVREISVKNK
jgi:lysophospholipase L1-like esterase